MSSALVLASSTTWAQQGQNHQGWHLKDKQADGYYGISLNKAYDFLRATNRVPQVVTVGVVDSGIDTAHVDLTNVLWRNAKEVAGNRKDDDRNGYADDVYGWNFLGGKDEHSNVTKDSYEVSRFYWKHEAKFANIDPNKVKRKDKAIYADWLRAKAELETKKENLKPTAYRMEVTGDNYNKIKDRFYGNSNVQVNGKSALHGTHVAGIIGAERNNGVGMDGVADNVRLLSVRAVPDGDEHDKDIALGIRYAVDRGAKVINMSFGKGYSPEKKWVDKAVRYAEKKGVLLVQAAGNDKTNIDVKPSYPTAIYTNGKKASNWITVGASGDTHIGGIATPFTNYGKEMVDVFAPGIQIYSTAPGGDKYANLAGTSMAAPVVSGLAALIMSYYPELNYKEVKYVIETSAVAPAEQLKTPGTGEIVLLSDISRTGGIVNAYEAVKLADQLAKDKK